MCMSEYEIISSVFGGLTAIGTVGAVVVTLWQSSVFRKTRVKLKIHEDMKREDLCDGEIVSTQVDTLYVIRNLNPREIKIVGYGFAFEKNKQVYYIQGQETNSILIPAFDERPIPIKQDILIHTIKNAADKENIKKRDTRFFFFIRDALGKISYCKSEKKLNAY